MMVGLFQSSDFHKESIFRNVVHRSSCHPLDGSSLKKELYHIHRKPAVSRRSVKCRLLSSPFDGWANPFSYNIIVVAEHFQERSATYGIHGESRIVAVL